MLEDLIYDAYISMGWLPWLSKMNKYVLYVYFHKYVKILFVCYSTKDHIQLYMILDITAIILRSIMPYSCQNLCYSYIY